MLAFTLLPTPVAAAPTPPARAGQVSFKHLFTTRGARARATASDVAGPGGTTSNSGASGGNLIFNGGSVQTSPVIYVSFWGAEWQNGFSTGGYSSGQAQNYITSFLGNVGGSSWMSSQTQYCQGVPSGSQSCATGKAFVSNPGSQLKGTWTDTTAVPANPTDTDIQNAASRAAAHFGANSNATYMIFTPTGKSESGFGTNWCAWHGWNSSVGQFAYAYIPYMPDAGGSCGVNAVNRSNDSFGHGYFDGFSIVGGHEYAESVTDPFPNSGWIDSSGQENGDKCQWNSTWPNANSNMGSTYFAIQPLWSNADNACAYSTTAAVNCASNFPGYNILTASGGIYSFADASYHGNLIDHGYPGPAVGLGANPDGSGYSILTSFGGIYSFNAAYLGNLIDHGYPGPAVGLAATPTGKGYAILTRSGGVYTFGDAAYYGNLIDHGFPGPAVSMSYTADGRGYVILTASGGIYTFGSAPYLGNLIDHGYPGPAVSVAYTRGGLGYYILTASGGLYSFGQAPYCGNLIDHRYPGPATALATTP